MLKYKKPRRKGKVSFTRYFQKLNPGDSVAVVKELSEPFGYSNRIQGRTGKVVEKRGKSYYVEIRELGKMKKYALHPIHLKKIMEAK